MTGGAGFIGSNLCEALLGLGYRVRCLDDLSTGKQANVDIFLKGQAGSTDGDIKNNNLPACDRYEFIRGDVKDASGGRLEPNFGPERAGDIKHSNADISKAREKLGYDPEWSFDRGIRAAIEWYSENL